jgi:hypothetical protein
MVKGATTTTERISAMIDNIPDTAILSNMSLDAKNRTRKAMPVVTPAKTAAGPT